jgi:hypothetical protein
MLSLTRAAVLASLLTVAACSGGGADEDTTTTTRPATTTTADITTTTVAEITVEAAQQQYLDIVAPGNVIIAAFRAAGAEDEYRDLLGDLAAEIEVMVNKLRSADWPTDAQDEVDAMIEAALAERIVINRALEAGDPEAIAEQLSQAFSDAAAAASAVRLALGLPLN